MSINKQGNKWRARIWENSRNASIGSYNSYEDAQKALEIYRATGVKLSPYSSQLRPEKKRNWFQRLFRIK